MAGKKSVGVDINPLATMVARAKTWVTAKDRRQELLALGSSIGEQSLQAGSDARRGSHVPHRGSKRRDRALAGWFAPHVRREIEGIAGAIDGVTDPDFASVLRSVLSATLYKVSQRASDTDSHKVERHIARGFASRLFLSKLTELCAGLEALCRERRGGHPHVICGDSRKLRRLGIGEGGFDCVITSPPYPGTYDYAEHQELRLTFLSMPADFKSKEIGSRSRFTGKKSEADKKALLEWRKSFAQALGEISRALHLGGHLVLVVGDSVAGTMPVFADDVAQELCPKELILTAWARGERPILGGVERDLFHQRGKYEHLLLFTKT
jgi:hypothetical protein